MKKIDIGCGTSKRSGYIGLDNLDLEGVDIKHDLNQFPYPFNNNEIDEVWMDNVLEHLENPFKVMEEIYRISKNGAIVNIGVPYFRSFYATIDPTHRHYFGVCWFNYFEPEHLFYQKYQYTQAKFKIEKIEFDRESNKSRVRFFRKMLIKFAEKKPEIYEAWLSQLYPLNSLTFYLKVVK